MFYFITKTTNRKNILIEFFAFLTRKQINLYKCLYTKEKNEINLWFCFLKYFSFLL